MGIRDAMAFQELQRQVATLAALVEQLLEESAEQAMRLATLETATATECAAIAARRAGDAARQQRRRHRHVTEALPV